MKVENVLHPKEQPNQEVCGFYSKTITFALHTPKFSTAFKKHQVTAKNNENLAYLVVHFTPQHVKESPRYRQWVELFSPRTHHLVLNECNTCMGSISVHRVQHKLYLLHNTIFPLLGEEGTKTDLDKKEEQAPSLKRMKTEMKVGQSDNNSQSSESVDSHYF